MDSDNIARLYRFNCGTVARLDVSHAPRPPFYRRLLTLLNLWPRATKSSLTALRGWARVARDHRARAPRDTVNDRQSIKTVISSPLSSDSIPTAFPPSKRTNKRRQNGYLREAYVWRVQKQTIINYEI